MSKRSISSSRSRALALRPEAKCSFNDAQGQFIVRYRGAAIGSGRYSHDAWADALSGLTVAAESITR